MNKTNLAVVVLIWIFASASVSVAQQRTATIRAGEHPTYSRLVIPAANDLAWELRTFGREATLMLPTDAITFSTDTIFDRIPKSRLLSVDAKTVAGDTFLRLQLACDCDVSAKTEGGSLILDINDKEATADLLAKPEPRPESANNDQPEDEPKKVPSDLAQRLISQLNKAAEQGLIELNDPKEETQVGENPAEPVQDAPALEVAQAPEIGLQPVEETLDGLEGVAERLERGLLDALGPDDLASSVRIQVPDEIRTPEEAGRTARNTSKDIDKPVEPDRNHCVDDELLDVAYWASQRPYSEQVAALQARVFGEFDEPDSDAVLQLARFYIFFGLGTETTSLLKDLKLDQHQADLLLELANTVEGKPHVPGGILDKAAGCPGAVELWRTAALDTTETQPLSNPENLIERFSELPIHVRRIIGPRLVQSFITRGQEAAANQVFSTVDRAVGYHGDKHELRRADLLHLDGAFPEAEQIYWKLVYENSETSADAAVLLVQSLLQRGAPLPPNVLTALEALAFEFRDSPKGKDLFLTTIQAKAGSNNIGAAINMSLEEIDANPGLAAVYYSAIDTILSKTSIQQMGAVQYLELIFSNLETVSSKHMTHDTKIVIANEMIGAGLPNSALKLLETVTSVDTDLTNAITAKAALKLGQAEAVIALNQTDPKNAVLARLAARAHSSLGQHQDAINTTAGIEAIGEDPALLWRAGDWNEAANSNTGPEKILATFMANRQSKRPPQTGLDLTKTEDAMTQAIPAQQDITLKYANDIQLQSSTIRKFLSDTIADM